MNYEYFDKYLDDNEDLNKYIVSNYKNKRIVYMEVIEGEKYFIKKYIPYGKRKIRTAFGLYEDRAIHYEKIQKKIEKINIPCVKLEYKKIKRSSFFKRTSIIVTKDSGNTLENYLNEFERNKDLIDQYYNIFEILIKNKIYPIDYNTTGALIGLDKCIRLTDFDDYRTNVILTNTLKKRIIKNLKRVYEEIGRREEEKEFLKNKIKVVIKNVGW